ncbi:calpain family cysteine protease [Xylariales sp. AK1849]|nr:calpain family cysteine protease [Xylariales sp. AK1849]
MPRKTKQQTPQEAIDEFWSKFTTKAPGKANTIIPQNEYAARAAKHSRQATGITTQASYDEAAALCKAKVAKIVKECRRVNQKYRDPHFDLEFDLKWGKRDTLESLSNVKDRPPSDFKPKSVKRVTDVFEDPRFYIDGPTANDVRQGRDGDCWLLAALCTLSNKPGLIERCCVARDEQVGIYGFVFHRDGEWISEIIDDKLFLTKPDFEESFLERMLWEDRERVNSEEQYRRAYQSGSGALYFAQCEHADETWLPLLEKAYAKAHGDYSAIEGGFTGEGIEDLTGGVTSELYTSDILDKEYFWQEELMKVNMQFLFGCSTGMWGIGWGDRKGILELHAYSIMRAADGSKEWTPEWLLKLNHRFGDDGAFWISYDDLLRKYQAFDRTRLFGPEWKVTSLWTTLSVPWTLDYHSTQFAFSLSQAGPVVLVLSQLDDRYYRGLGGQYRFELNFRLHKAGQEGYVVRSISPYCQSRSVNVELELDAGEYTVLLKINATRNMGILPLEEVVRDYARERRDKLVAVGMSYDLAHSKGTVVESEEEKKADQDAEKRKKGKEKWELKKKLMADRRRVYYLNVKDQKKRRKRKAKAEEKARLENGEKDARRKTEKSTLRAAKPVSSDVPAWENVKEDEPEMSDKRKPAQILSPSSAPCLDGSKRDLATKGSDSGTGDSIQSPSTNPGKSSPEALVLDNVQCARASEDPFVKAVVESLSGRNGFEEAQSDTMTNSITSVISSKDEDSLGARSPHEGSSDIEPTNVGTDLRPEAADSESDVPLFDEPDISSVSDISDGELEIELERRANVPSPPTPKQHVDSAEEEDEFERNPWNAVATVGLRVYYKVSDANKDKEIVKLRVVRPNPHDKRGTTKSDEQIDGNSKDSVGSTKDEDAVAEQVEGNEAEGKNEMGLDVDDSSKDATLIGDQERRKKSIVPAGDPDV